MWARRDCSIAHYFRSDYELVINFEKRQEGSTFDIFWER